jgi:hypothetical protein
MSTCALGSKNGAQEMCDRCEEIDATIARYMRLERQVDDQKLHDAAMALVAELEAEKRTLHPEQE